jgi:hypothetical protein
MLLERNGVALGDAELGQASTSAPKATAVSTPDVQP